MNIIKQTICKWFDPTDEIIKSMTGLSQMKTEMRAVLAHADATNKKYDDLTKTMDILANRTISVTTDNINLRDKCKTLESDNDELHERCDNLVSYINVVNDNVLQNHEYFYAVEDYINEVFPEYQKHLKKKQRKAEKDRIAAEAAKAADLFDYGEE